MQATVGRIVHYTLSAFDADEINQTRSGSLTHKGNHVAEGDVCAAVVVRTFGGPAANLKVLLDGNDTYWATSRTEGEGPSHWAWPERV